MIDDADRFLLAFHERHPGCTRIAFSNGKSAGNGGSSYELLSILANSDRVLDLGCGDAHLLSLLSNASSGNIATGLDMSPDELRAARQRTPGSAVVLGRAQSLPFAARSFSLVLSHFAFHLMSDLEAIVSEIGRVLVPGGRFATIIGGGPKLGDAFETFIDLISSDKRDDQKIPRIGERRGHTDEGLQSLFGTSPAFGTEPSIEDFYIDFGGSFDELWPRLTTVYDLMYYSEDELMALRERFRRELGASATRRIPCTMAIRRVIAQRAW